MSYSSMSDEDVFKDIANKIENLRLEKKIKETDLEQISGISRKTLYNFKHGITGFSLKNFIRLLRAMDEIDRLQHLFSDKEDYSPRESKKVKIAQRVRDKKIKENSFKWGDEE